MVAGTTSLGRRWRDQRVLSPLLEGQGGQTSNWRVHGPWGMTAGEFLTWTSYQGNFCLSVQGKLGTGGPKAQLYSLLGVCEESGGNYCPKTFRMHVWGKGKVGSCLWWGYALP